MLNIRLQLCGFSVSRFMAIFLIINVLSLCAFSQCDEPEDCNTNTGFEIGDGSDDGSSTGNPTPLIDIELPSSGTPILAGFDLGDGSDDGSSGSPNPQNPTPLASGTKWAGHSRGPFNGLFDTNVLATDDAIWVGGLVKQPRSKDSNLTYQDTNNQNMFVARYERGAQIWAGGISCKGFMQMGNMSTDDNGNLALSGNFRGTLRLGNRVLKSRGYFDGFIVCLDAFGQVLWVHQVMGQGTVVFENMSFNSEGHLEIVVTGPFPQGLPQDGLQRAAFTFGQFGDLR